MSALMLAFASCQKTPEKSGDGTGYLSVEDLAVTLDGNVDVKSSVEETGVDGYTVLIVDEDENEVMRKTYADVLSYGRKVVYEFFRQVSDINKNRTHMSHIKFSVHFLKFGLICIKEGQRYSHAQSNGK